MIQTGDLLLVLDRAAARDGTGVKVDLQNLPPKLAGQLLRANVLEVGPDGQATLKLPSGETLQARLDPPLPVGSRLQLLARTPTAPVHVLRALPPPAPAQVVATPQALTQAAAQTGPIVLRFALPGATGTTPSPSPVPTAPTTDIPEPTPTLPKLTVGQTLPLSVQAGRPFPAVGATVIGRVTTPPEGGQQTLTLVNGTKLDFPIPPVLDDGTEVQLRIVSKGQAQLVSLKEPAPSAHPAPAPKSPVPTASGTSAPPTAAATPAPRPALKLDVGVPVRATVLPAKDGFTTLQLADGQVMKLPPSPLLRPGQTVTITRTPDGMVDLEPQPLPTPAPTARPTPPLAPSAPAARPTPSSTPQAAPPAAAATPDSPEAPVPAPRLTGVVTARTDSGELTVRLPSGQTFQAHSPRPLPLGAQITLSFTDEGHAHILNIRVPTAPAHVNSLYAFMTKWEALDQALAHLRTHDPAAFAAVKSRLPNLGDSFLPNMMRLADAVQTNNLEALLGREALNVLRQTGLDGPLMNDLSQLQTLHQKHDLDGWRALPFPFWDDERDEPGQGGFFWRNDDEEERRPGTPASVRFVVQLSMSQLGPLQLDGLIRGTEMRLKLRSLEDLGVAFAAGLQTVVNRAMAEAGLTGGVDVEVTDRFEVDPLHDFAAAVPQSQNGLDVNV
jgi:hypothetical protein